MEKSELELFFDKFIANDFSNLVVEEEMNEEQQFLSLLPNELRKQASPGHTGTTTTTSTDVDPNTERQQTVKVFPEKSTSWDHNSQNATAAVTCPGGPSRQESCPQSIPAMPLQINPQIINVISTVNLGCPLDLNFIASKTWNVMYNSKNFSVLFMRIRKPRSLATISKSGRVTCMGAESEEQSMLLARKYARIVQKLGFPVRFLNFKIHNIVASCHTFPISLERMALYHHCSYEPEIHPGLFYSVMPGVTMTIFVTGKIFLSGKKLRLCPNIPVYGSGMNRAEQQDGRALQKKAL
uniref:uncharacterized protein n=1 Tax=Semicossyphus pulcher TaxID=241346 RepID=UPI0037E89018